MKYRNPIVKGFYPDPSICCADGIYYMVCSSFQYFPGVPLFKSADLVNWKQIGHCLTRKSQIMLESVGSSEGVFAPTIRYNNGTFYMVTTNNSTNQNFYITTNDIGGEWSEPVFIDQGGIDPSLYFEDGHTYFISNGFDDCGVSGIVQCEINIETGEKLTPSRTIWQGSGGRFLESPHMYKIGGEYYLMAAEGGTEYGHMITYARGSSVWGEFKGYPHNPVLTNRNLGGYQIQGVGHGDLVQDKNGNWFILHLGFRQIGDWSAYHHLGREVFMTPVKFGDDGWFTAGNNGTTVETFEIQGDFEQSEKRSYTFENSPVDLDWCFLRHPDMSRYELDTEKFMLHGTDTTIDMTESPTFVGIRQRDFCADISCNLSITGGGEAGITLYMDENHHYDIAVRECADGGYEALLRLNIGDVKAVQKTVKLPDNNAVLKITADNFCYNFSVCSRDNTEWLGSAQTRYLSSEVAGGFTGVIIGLYAQHENCTAEFTSFSCQYK